jgi:hypothetical protein
LKECDARWWRTHVAVAARSALVAQISGVETWSESRTFLRDGDAANPHSTFPDSALL